MMIIMVSNITDAARMIESNSDSSYIYRNVIIECNNRVVYLHYRKDGDYCRTVGNRYVLSIKDNIFDKKDLTVIFSNIDYLIGIIQKRINNLFNMSNEYEGVNENFEVLFDKEQKQLIVSFDYEITDNLTPDYKNTLVTEIIVSTLLDGAVELADNEEDSYSAMKIIDSDGTISNARYGTQLQI